MFDKPSKSNITEERKLRCGITGTGAAAPRRVEGTDCWRGPAMSQRALTDDVDVHVTRARRRVMTHLLW